MSNAYPYRAKAAQILIVCCLFWAFSFPVVKGLQLLAEREVPGGSTLFASASCVVYRFGISAVLVALFVGRGFRQLRREEVIQGVIVGVIGSIGLFFQVDGLAYTKASTSAFLTQGYCVLIPVWQALRHRRMPGQAVWVACVLAVAGAAILAGLQWGDLRLGRGELETLLASVFFAGQILWVEDPRFAGNDTLRWSAVMFAVMALVCAPVALLAAPRPMDAIRVYATWEGLGLTAVLVFCCTLVSYLLMNRWQRELPAAEAGLLYCTEPVFTSVIGLVMPAWISSVVGVAYANEQLTWRLLAGGVLILGANVWLQLRGGAAAPEKTVNDGC